MFGALLLRVGGNLKGIVGLVYGQLQVLFLVVFYCPWLFGEIETGKGVHSEGASGVTGEVLSKCHLASYAQLESQARQVEVFHERYDTIPKYRPISLPTKKNSFLRFPNQNQRSLARASPL